MLLNQWEIPTKAKCDILKILSLPHMLLVFVLSLVKFVDPCWEIYHAPKVKITYTHLYMLLLHWEYAKTCFHPPTKFAPTLGVDKKIFVRKMLYVLKDSDLSK
jgi:hypothetical protein